MAFGVSLILVIIIVGGGYYIDSQVRKPKSRYRHIKVVPKKGVF